MDYAERAREIVDGWHGIIQIPATNRDIIISDIAAALAAVERDTAAAKDAEIRALNTALDGTTAHNVRMDNELRAKDAKIAKLKDDIKAMVEGVPVVAAEARAAALEDVAAAARYFLTSQGDESKYDVARMALEHTLAALDAADAEVEAAAKAAWEDGLRDEDPRWGELEESTKIVYRKDARAALTASRKWMGDQK